MDLQQRDELTSILHECMETCNHCFDACLQEEDPGHMVNCIRLDRECSDFCGYVEQALTRDTPFAEELLRTCAVICRACADECRQHHHDHCQRCAEVCDRCAAMCEKITAA
ncbi:four-helix bundle copper-binding protein [Alkalicoccus chagannorensis]|uniref:four-helix bundle copper-binding protein n=1 Tax=Alkalicoccus chagannorensis TaxID=427072 RepID=UPI0004007FA1|nr:four-helix bundle copper-binding protein [Alkalicoccus chagannorensis]